MKKKYSKLSKIFFISLIHIILTGLLDALVKGNVVAAYNNDWSLVPWFFKDANLLWPFLLLVISVLAGIFIMRKFKFGWKYFIFFFVWGISGLESLSYWFWIWALGIGQTLWWLPDTSFFWWYPKTAPWLNSFIHLKLLSGWGDVTRRSVLLGTVVSFVLNLVLVFILGKHKTKQ